MSEEELGVGGIETPEAERAFELTHEEIEHAIDIVSDAYDDNGVGLAGDLSSEEQKKVIDALDVCVLASARKAYELIKNEAWKPEGGIREQLHELEIVIDREKRSMQVDTIIESDMFASVLEQAKSFRQGRAESGDRGTRKSDVPVSRTPEEAKLEAMAVLEAVAALQNRMAAGEVFDKDDPNEYLPIVILAARNHAGSLKISQTQKAVEFKIDIDKKQIRKDVEEVTDTDYFRDLQAKAMELKKSRAR